MENFEPIENAVITWSVRIGVVVGVLAVLTFIAASQGWV